MPRPIRAILSAVSGAALASLVFLSPERSAVPLWMWLVWIGVATMAGGAIGLRGPFINRNKFGVMQILIGSFYIFMLGAIWGQEPSFKAIKTNAIAGVVFLAVFTLLIRLMIRLMRWADRKWS